MGEDLGEDPGSDGHDYLLGECPWYKHVTEEGGDADPATHCRASHAGEGSSRLSALMLTPRTPEASTVVKPTVPPGGPGLFHMKGHHLPPYVEHLWFHLAPKYGKHRAYGMAVGIVKKWAAGVNPGGWKTKSGKGKRTHADVRAAAAKNVAEWEKERAEARARHGSGGHVRAALAEPLPGAGSSSGPSAADVLALSSAVPDCRDPALSASVRVHLRTAAAKLGKDDGQGALAALRAALTSVYAASRADLTAQPYVAPGGPGTASVTAPRPAASLLTPGVLASRRRQQAWRHFAEQVDGLTRRLRGHQFPADQFVPSPALRMAAGPRLRPSARLR